MSCDPLIRIGFIHEFDNQIHWARPCTLILQRLVFNCRSCNGLVGAPTHRSCRKIRTLVLQGPRPRTSVLLGPRTTYLYHWLINNILHSSVSAGPPWARGPIRANRSNRLIAGHTHTHTTKILYTILNTIKDMYTLQVRSQTKMMCTQRGFGGMHPPPPTLEICFKAKN